MNKIKEARLQARISQARMAELLEIPKRTIENWEVGVSTPPTYVERFVINELKRLTDNILKEIFIQDHSGNEYGYECCGAVVFHTPNSVEFNGRRFSFENYSTILLNLDDIEHLEIK